MHKKPRATGKTWCSENPRFQHLDKESDCSGGSKSKVLQRQNIRWPNPAKVSKEFTENTHKRDCKNNQMKQLWKIQPILHQLKHRLQHTAANQLSRMACLCWEGPHAVSNRQTDWGPYFNGLKRKWEAPSASSFVGGSMAMLLVYRREKCKLPSPLRAMSAFESDELIFWQRVCSLRWDRCMTTWFQTSNGSVFGQIIWPNSHMEYDFLFTSPQINFSKENLTHIWYAVTVVLFNDIHNTL